MPIPNPFANTALERIDVINANVMFLVRKLRGLKSLDALEEMRPEYDATLRAIGDLRYEIKSSASRLTASLRATERRGAYLHEFLRNEYRSNKRRIEADIAFKEASNFKKGFRTARLIAHFIVAEAAKLNAPFREAGDLNLRKVSHVPDSAFTDAHKIAQVLTANNDDAAQSIDFLEGMDSSL